MTAPWTRQLGPAIEEPAQPAVGRLAGRDSLGRVLVELRPDAPALVARVAVAGEPRALEQAINDRRQALLLFEGGDPALPIVVGLLQPALQAGHAPIEQAAPASESFVVEADADGTRVRIEARDELVLRCGQATITLRRNGRVVVRGAHVETYSTGLNRIKGGQVRIN